MMRRLAQAMVNRNVAWAVVLLVLLGAGGGLLLSTELEHEDDLLAFLPATDPDVELFHRLNKRFGGLDVALVGIDADDVFSSQTLSRLMQLTRELEDTPGLDRVLSLTNIVDFTPDQVRGGIITGPLISRAPRDEADRLAIRAKVLSRDHVIGNLVDAEGKAALVYCFLAHGSDTKEVAARIRTVARSIFPAPQPLYWGGGPFISTYIYNSTQRDMRRLTPWAVLAMVMVMMIAFRDFRGTCLALLSTSFGIIFSLALMVLCEVKINIALSAMPVILFAVGSAYGIHILARYYALVRTMAPDVALRRTLETTGLTVLAAGLTTVVSLLSFVTMDLLPMRTFGLFTAIGVLATLILALTFIPAVIRLARLKGHGASRSREDTGSPRLLERLIAFPLRRRALVGGVVGLLTAAGAALTLTVSAQIEMSTMFSRGSPPDRSERFMAQRFGGSQFLWIHAAGDMTSPEVLREVQWIADGVSRIDHIASTIHVGDALSRANEAMEGLRRIPDTTAKVKLLYAMMSGDASVRQLVSRDRRHALIQVKVNDSSAEVREELLAGVEGWLAGHTAPRYQRLPRQDRRAGDRVRLMVTARILAAAHALGSPRSSLVANEQRLATAVSQLARAGQLVRGAARQPAVRQQVVAELRRFLRSEESAVTLAAAVDDDDQALRIARAVAALGPDPDDAPLRRAIASGLGEAPEQQAIDDLLISLGTPIDETWKRAASTAEAQRLIALAGLTARATRRMPDAAEARSQLVARVANALLELEAEPVLVPLDAGVKVAAARPAPGRDTTATAVALTVNVNGLPVLHRALSNSALRNQIKSLSAALLPVIVIMALLFRSLRTGLLVASPTLLTLLLIYGGMGLFGVRLDIGTAMLACIILGAGVDYAVHLVAGWQSRDGSLADAARRAARHTGVAIWTNAVMVAIGFGVLTLGEAKPLKNVGGLTAGAMLVAAAATFLLIPVLARRRSYALGSVDPHSEDHEQAEDVEDGLTQPSSAAGRPD